MTFHKELTSKFLIITAFLLGLLVTNIATYIYVASAHGGDTNLVHACVRSNGNIKIVSENVACGDNETAVDWNKAVPGEGTFPLICPGCNLISIGSRLAAKDLSGSYLPNALIGVGGEPTINLARTIFNDANLDTATISNADLIGAKFLRAYLVRLGATSLNLTNVDFSNANMAFAQLVDSNLTNTNFTNVNFTYANLQGAANGSTANFSGVTWSGTICPDGTNSDNNGNTCIGHF